MADILRVAGLVPSIASPLPPATCRITGLLAGENIAAGDACYIASDGTVMRTNGTAATAPAKVRGFALVPTDQGEAVTLCLNLEIRYASAMTPGKNIYASTTAGNIGDAATTGGTGPCGFVIDAQRIFVFPSTY